MKRPVVLTTPESSHRRSPTSLDLKFIRENAEIVRENLRKRGNAEKIDQFQRLLEVDNELRRLKKVVQDLRAERNRLSREIGRLKTAGQDTLVLVEQANRTNASISEAEATAERLEHELRVLQMNIPNLLHESVPYGRDESDNVVVREWGGRPEHDFEPKSHVDLLELLDLADISRAAKVSGARFYYLKNQLVLLDLAMQMLALEMLTKKGFHPIYPPFMMRREPYEGVTDLADFRDVMYKIEDEDLYLIATSEHPMAAMYMGEIFEPTQLPIRLAGISTCFRKEAGSHGKDTKGIFRVHQFNKVEQFVFCRPDESWTIHEELLSNVESFFKALKIPYRIVNVCTGDIGTVAAKKYDLETWMPVQKTYREAASCSNCTAYQATRLGIKYRLTKGGTEKSYVHTLNSTMVANPRALVALMENLQREDGSIPIPVILRKYLPNELREIVPPESA
ncbi:MAG: serine--tRNA ligase [Candidatus Thorarchaeota archaeon]